MGAFDRHPPRSVDSLEIGEREHLERADHSSPIGSPTRTASPTRCSGSRSAEPGSFLAIELGQERAWRENVDVTTERIVEVTIA